jgi:excisionase family DNA binding protein
MIMTIQRKNEDFLTTREAAAELGFAEDTVRRYINKGMIKAQMFGNSWAVSRTEIERYREEKRPRGRPSEKNKN